MPSASDDFSGKNCFIILNPSKGHFHLYGDDPEELKIRDIANALSKQCRFTGHLEEDYWYSVAEHSVDVSHIIQRMGGSVFEQFCGLMHDTSEAYLSDINAPFKREMGQYYEKEALIWARVAAKWNLPLKLPDIVKEADWLALFIEARHFVVGGNVALMENWVGYDPHCYRALKPPFDLYRMKGMTFTQARWAFLDRFQELQDAIAAS